MLNANGSYKNPLTKDIGPCLHILQLNIEGISRDKCEHLSRVATDNNIDLIALQETHITDDSQLPTRAKIPGYKLIAYITSQTYGSNVYIREDILEFKVTACSRLNNIETIGIEISGQNIICVYKPPNINWPNPPLPSICHPGVYIGDFNSHHTSWGYKNNNENGEILVNWSDQENLFLTYDAKDLKSFYSARWQNEYNPDLCFLTRDELDIPLQHTKKLLRHFPRTQHRPVLLKLGIQLPVIRSIQKPRWNFQKAKWDIYTAEVETHLRWIPPKLENYTRFVGVIMGAAKRNIPRGYRKEYIPCWNQETEKMYLEYQKTANPKLGQQILQAIANSRKEKWENTTKDLNFTTSSREAWSLLRKLGTANPTLTEKPKLRPSDIALHIKNRTEKVNVSQTAKNEIKAELKISSEGPEENPDFSSAFTDQELNEVIKNLKVRKAAGLDGIYPEFIKHLGPAGRKWLKVFYTDILQKGKVPQQFKIAQTLAILKPGKSSDDPSSYRPIALLSICYKLLERLIYNRIYDTIDNQLPPEQAGFRAKRSCCDQVLALTSFIEAGYQEGKKTSVAFIDLTAAYDTVWLDGLILKIRKTIRCAKITRLLENMLRNRYFKVTLGHTTSKSYTIKNGLPQGSVLAPLLFNLYISDLPDTTSHKFCYADDMAIATQTSSLEEGEKILSSDLCKLNNYYEKWRLCPNPNKTEVCAFHLSNSLANKTLNVMFREQPVKHNDFPKYLGISLDRSLTYKKHLEITSQKLKTRVSLIKKIAGTNWGAQASTLRTATQSLVYSTAEYCSPVWARSHHTKKVDVLLNEAMRTISGTVKSTPIPLLHALSGIPPPELRRQQATVREWNKIKNSTAFKDLPIHRLLENPPCIRLKSRQPIWEDPIIKSDQLFDLKDAWKSKWTSSDNLGIMTNLDPTAPLHGTHLSRRMWCKLNRIRTGHGRCKASLHKWGFIDSPECDCGAPEQTIKHIVIDCPLRKFPGNWDDFLTATPDALNWIASLDVDL